MIVEYARNAMKDVEDVTSQIAFHVLISIIWILILVNANCVLPILVIVKPVLKITVKHVLEDFIYQEYHNVQVVQ